MKYDRAAYRLVGGLGAVLFVGLCLLPTLVVYLETLSGETGMGDFRLSDWERQSGLLLKSLGVATVAVLVAVFLGTPTGLLLARFRIPARGLFCYGMIFLLLVPSYIFSISVLQVFGARGWILEFLSNGNENFWDPYHWWTAGMVLGWWSWPLVAMPVWVSLQLSAKEQEEWALLNTGTFRTLLRVTLPQSLDGLLAGAFLVFLFSWSNFAIPDFFRVQVYAAEVFSQFSAFFDLKAASLAALPLIVGVLAVGFLAGRFLTQFQEKLEGSQGTQDFQLTLFGVLRKGAVSGWMGFIVFLALIPFIVLIAQAFSREVLQTAFDTAVPEILLTLRISLMTALITFPLGWMAALWINPRPGRFRRSLELLALLPLAIPAPIVGIGLIKLYNRPDWIGEIYRSEAILIFVCLARFLPLSILSWSRGLARIPGELEDAARVDGAGWWGRQMRIAWPLCLPFSLTGFFLVFCFSAGELGASVLVVPPGTTTLSVRIFTLLHYGADEMVAALCLFLISCIVVPFLLYFGARRLVARLWQYPSA
jgi:iron(III) transport system permease protein